MILHQLRHDINRALTPRVPKPMQNQQQILKAIAAKAQELGRAPTLLEFVTDARIPKNWVFRLFPRWNEAVQAAGLQPFRLYRRPEDHELLIDWGQTVRKLRVVPSARAYDLHGTYYPATLEKRFGSWPVIPQVFRDFAKGQREWADVLALLREAEQSAAAALSQQTGSRHTIVGARDTRARCASSRASNPSKTSSHPPLKQRPTYGEPLDFPTLRHEPMNEQGVVLLFGMLAKDLGYVIESVQTGFPDCEAKRQIGPSRWQRVNLEFEYESRNFHEHGHPLTGCDVIVCWRHNWPDCPANIEVLELSTRIHSFCSAAR
ncbi:MAG TPA: hypothetical protein VFR42_04580 [Candidatus Acidoferrum sp.]|nr:hypothetical protein [Candidatus Acidoferrum sp.]